MKSFVPPIATHSHPQALPITEEQHEKLNTLAEIKPERVPQVNCSATTVTDVWFREILLMPTVWLWHGNLVIFGANLIEKVKVEERPAQYDRAGKLLKMAEYVIDCEYKFSGGVNRLTWQLASELVTSRSIFYFGEKDQESLWFIPCVNSRTRVYSNQSPHADKLVPAWANAMDGADLAKNDDVAAEHLYGGETAATYAILLHMQGTNLPKATKLFEQLAVEAKQQSPQPWPISAESEAQGDKSTHEVTLRKDRIADMNGVVRTYIRS